MDRRQRDFRRLVQSQDVEVIRIEQSKHLRVLLRCRQTLQTWTDTVAVSASDRRWEKNYLKQLQRRLAALRQPREPT